MPEQAIAGTHLAEERIETIDGQSVGAKRKEIQRRFNADAAILQEDRWLDRGGGAPPLIGRQPRPIRQSGDTTVQLPAFAALANRPS